MSIFQCDGCGCAENTALTTGRWGPHFSPDKAVAKGLSPAGRYCSQCWDGKWHGKFPQNFYPKGTMRTNAVGNLEPIAPA